MWNQCGISCIKPEQVWRGNPLSLCRLTDLYWLTFDTSGSSAAVKCPCFWMWDWLIMNNLFEWLTGGNGTHVEGKTFTQYFNISFLLHNINGPTLVGDFILQPPLSVWSRKDRGIWILFLWLVTQPRGGLFSGSSMHVPPPTHENVGNVKWGLIAMAFGASTTMIDLP